MLGQTRKRNKQADNDEYCCYHLKQTVKAFPCKNVVVGHDQSLLYVQIKNVVMKKQRYKKKKDGIDREKGKEIIIRYSTKKLNEESLKK